MLLLLLLTGDMYIVVRLASTYRVLILGAQLYQSFSKSMKTEYNGMYQCSSQLLYWIYRTRSIITKKIPINITSENIFGYIHNRFMIFMFYDENTFRCPPVDIKYSHI